MGRLSCRDLPVLQPPVHRHQGAPNAGTRCVPPYAALYINIQKQPEGTLVQSDLAFQGRDALFKLRATELGTDAWVLAAAWLHILADGAPILQPLQEPTFNKDKEVKHGRGKGGKHSTPGRSLTCPTLCPVLSMYLRLFCPF